MMGRGIFHNSFALKWIGQKQSSLKITFTKHRFLILGISRLVGKNLLSIRFLNA